MLHVAELTQLTCGNDDSMLINHEIKANDTCLMYLTKKTESHPILDNTRKHVLRCFFQKVAESKFCKKRVNVCRGGH